MPEAEASTAGAPAVLPVQSRSVLLLFAVAALSSAALLFLLEPMAGKMLLPRLGGAPSVWNTCMVFFQAGLLAGYAYAHLLVRRLPLRRQVALHGLLLALAVCFLPVGVGGGAGPPEGRSPLGWQIAALTRGIGIPFLALSATAPLLQGWLAATAHRRAGDPYVLYAASNLGSLGGLLAYPLLVEPLLPLGGPGRAGDGPTQSALWSAGFVLCALVVALCGVSAARPSRAAGQPARGRTRERATWRQRIRWAGFAFVPSSLLLGATAYMTTDIASVPLLWVAPLALYLLSFVLAFARDRRDPPHAASDVFAALCLLAAASLWAYVRPILWLLLILHPALVFMAGYVCHRRLAAERPAPDLLTDYYLAIGAGGVLGGAFNALLAPVLFAKVGTIEYPAALFLAALLRPDREASSRRRESVWRFLEFALPAAAALAAYRASSVVATFGPGNQVAAVAIQVGVPSALVLVLLRRPAGFALGLAVLLAAGWIRGVRPSETLYQARTYFGTYRVARRVIGPFRQTTPEGGTRTFAVPYNVLNHGSTRHGLQAVDPVLGAVPTSYYHRNSPIGEVFATFGASPRLDRVALVGLGIGTLAAYGRPGQRITCYELDPEIVRIARDPAYFTYLRDTQAEVEFVLGDGRLGLARAPDGAYGLIVLDAFSSDAIPVHLLTREAIELCMRKLRPDGLLAIHLTNQYLDLEPVVEAAAAHLGLAGLAKSVTVGTADELVEAKDRSTWAVLARDRDPLEPLNEDGSWIVLPLPDGGEDRSRYLWTDDRASILPVLRI